jgi:hypothetical protein
MLIKISIIELQTLNNNALVSEFGIPDLIRPNVNRILANLIYLDL